MKRLLLLALFALAAPASAQQIDVTFRFLPDLTPPEIEPVVRAFLPGSFNDWGPNTNGQIAIGAPSQMGYVEAENEYRYTIGLSVGQTYTYKIHYHQNQSGTQWVWISDPLNEVTTGPNNDSVIEVADPMAFQLAREQNAGGQVSAVSAGLFGTEDFASIQFQINDGPLQDGLAFYDPATGIFRYELPAPIASPGFFRLVAEDALGRTVDESVGILPPDVVDAARPDGLEDGVTVVDESTIRLSLFAPYKGFVHVIGTFNGWTADAASLLFRDAGGEVPATADSVWWWTEITGLTPGEEVAFQYLVDGALRIADPYSAKVLLPDDQFISEATYPGLMPYPAEAAGAPATAVTPGAAPYEWQTEGFERPAAEDLVIYELLVRDFLAAHDWDTLTDTLGYLERLGVNAIELMPVSEFGGNLNWGYQPTFHLALDKYYGPADQFKAFVDAAHARGMAVLLDVVYNHADQPSPLVMLYGCTEGGLYTNNPARHPFNVFCDLDHTQPATQHWLDRANRWWLEEYRVDGFRFDLSKGFMQTGPWDGYNPERIGLLTRMASAIWGTDPEVFLILEHLNPNQQEERELALFGRDEGFPGMMLWHNMNHAYSQSAMGYLDAGSDLTSTYPPFHIPGVPVPGIVTYMESHDEQWMMLKNLRFGNSAGDYDVKDLRTALDRQKLAGSFFFTVPGPRMMWQFGELGYGGGPGECLKPGSGNGDCAPSDPGRTAPKPIRWDYADHPDRGRLYGTWAALIGLRNAFEIFTSPETEIEIEAGANDPSRRIALSLADAPEGEPSEVVIIGNFGLEPREVAVTFPASGTWHEFFSDTELTLSGTSASILLEPGQARIYTDVDVPSPDPTLYNVDDEDGPAAPLTFALDPAYPNPFAEAATIAYALPAPSDVRLEVFDLLGRRVAVLVDGPQPAGRHRATFRADGLGAGTYLVRLAAAGATATHRVTLLR
jgi:glycosidase